MPLSASARAVMDQLAQLPPPPDFATIDPSQEIEYVRESRAATARPGSGEAVSMVRDQIIDTTGSASRVYVPATAPPQRGIVVHFHGGGWVTGSIEMSDAACRYLANRSGCVVLSATYRLAPEDPFPAAAEDAFTTLEWAARHATDFGADGTRIAAVGTSAGANLVAAACLMAADRGAAMPRLQVLVYPPLDARCQSPSYVDNAAGYYLTADQMRWFWSKYAAGADLENSYLSPLYAADLAGQPPAVIITAEFDPLRDDGARYADRLRASGVPVELHQAAGQIHSFMGMIDASPEARTHWQLVATKIQDVLA